MNHHKCLNLTPSGPSGKTVTTIAKCALDAQQGGATYVDQPVVVDGHLVTARAWQDHSDLLRQFLKLLKAAT